MPETTLSISASEVLTGAELLGQAPMLLHAQLVIPGVVIKLLPEHLPLPWQKQALINSPLVAQV
jgi:hypothetical protein